MPEITLITAIRVVVANMIPSRVRKLRSLLPRSDWRAPFTASQNDAWDCIQTFDDSTGASLTTTPAIHFIIASSDHRRLGPRPMNPRWPPYSVTMSWIHGLERTGANRLWSDEAIMKW